MQCVSKRLSLRGGELLGGLAFANRRGAPYRGGRFVRLLAQPR